MVNYRKNRTSALLLQPGAKMGQEAFHARYCAMPEGYRAELIDGMVFEPPPPFVEHGEAQLQLGALFLAYAGNTEGLQGLSDATIILSNFDEPQPDVLLRVLPKYGGRSSDIGGAARPRSKQGTFVKGAPELVAEIAYTSEEIDLGPKKSRYQAAGVLEYLVYCLDPKRLYWFDIETDQQIKIDADGILRSRTFPGLWLDQGALFECNYKQLIATLNLGMQTLPYARFAEKIVSAKKKIF